MIDRDGNRKDFSNHQSIFFVFRFLDQFTIKFIPAYSQHNSKTQKDITLDDKSYLKLLKTGKTL